MCFGIIIFTLKAEIIKYNNKNSINTYNIFYKDKNTFLKF